VRLESLSLLERVYWTLSEKRRRRWQNASQSNLTVPIISVGNITTGGTGKTPAVQWLVKQLQARERHPAVVSRGYGGKLSQAGAVVSDGRKVLLSAERAGDEPVLHARHLPGVPIIIGRDRNTAVQSALQFAPDVIVLDDAFQYWSLPRDVDLVLLDARRPFDNGCLLPRGHLRELPSGLQRATAIVLTRADAASAREKAATREQIRQWTKVPIWEAMHQPTALRDEASGEEMPLEKLSGAAVAAMSALAHNASFFRSLKLLGARLVEELGRRDHHAWREAEVQGLVKRAQQAGAQFVVTTEKDAVKMQSAWTQPLPLYSLRIAWQVEEAPTLMQLIDDRIAAKR
jgi:tetraacyldisaccharide 4'-kinase